ncbi:MAG: RadC family protein [Sulfuriferula sp.]
MVPLFLKGSVMNTIEASNFDLLAILVGKTKARLFAQKPLSELLGLAKARSTSNISVVREVVQPYVIDDVLMAAKELITRYLAEEAKQNDVLSSPGAVRNYLRLKLGDLEHEVFCTLFLDIQHRPIAIEELFRGTLSQTSVYPREVVKRALAHNAAEVIFAHNHPSGVSEPSMADQNLTNALKSALALVDIKVLDHFVVVRHQITSFAEKGLL